MRPDALVQIWRKWDMEGPVVSGMDVVSTCPTTTGGNQQGWAIYILLFGIKEKLCVVSH
jgi:hypothetical protein